MNADLIAVVALVSIALFVVGLKRLARIRSARSGNALMAGGMLLAVLLTLVEQGRIDWRWIIGGLVIGSAIGVLVVVRAQATQMPEIVARFNGYGGAASALVALSLFWGAVIEPVSADTAMGSLGAVAALTAVLSVVIGATTLSGSVLAELKLRGTVDDGRIPARALVMGATFLAALASGVVAVTAADETTAALGIAGLVVASLLVGVILVIPIGGADMPVVISLLNSFSGLAAAAAGFALSNALLIIAGTIVGAAGLILTQIMCVAMNRSLLNVMIGGFGGGVEADTSDYVSITSSDAEEAAMVMEIAESVVIVPGYGLAQARAQTAAYDVAKALQQLGVNVRFAIHPVAGRMPGHMNVVLAEAEVPYELLFEMDQINQDLPQTDVVIVVGANDVVNPAANTQPSSPIAGMPILDVASARRVFVIKRSLSPGYAGIKNELFDMDNTTMIFGDAKAVLDELAAELQKAAKR
jgi:H+-translocating NAD(P) transhydrogenase subunit beta